MQVQQCWWSCIECDDCLALSDTCLRCTRTCRSIDSDALEEDLAALTRLAAAQTELQQQEGQQEQAAAAREVLLDERYSQLVTALTAINQHLGKVYRWAAHTSCLWLTRGRINAFNGTHL